MTQVMVHFEFPDGTVEQYDNVWDDLRSSGNEHPNGLIINVGAEMPGHGFMVTDVWESQEAFMKFTEVLRPILEKRGIDTAVQPMIMPARYVVEPHGSMT
jgi:hypothetical protein